VISLYLDGFKLTTVTLGAVINETLIIKTTEFHGYRTEGRNEESIN
jgi:hypothetical protein